MIGRLYLDKIKRESLTMQQDQMHGCYIIMMCVCIGKSTSSDSGVTQNHCHVQKYLASLVICSDKLVRRRATLKPISLAGLWNLCEGENEKSGEKGLKLNNLCSWWFNTFWPYDWSFNRSKWAAIPNYRQDRIIRCTGQIYSPAWKRPIISNTWL